MTDSIVEIAIAEIAQKSLGMTEQFLEVHEIVHENGRPVVAAAVPEKDGKRTAVYFRVKDEKFFFVVYVSNTSEPEAEWANSGDYYSISLIASSKTLSLAGIRAMTALNITKGWNKGDAWNNSTRRFTVARFEPHTTPGTFEEKIESLLDLLEQDREGVQRLVMEADAGIQVVAIFHNGNTMLGGVHLTKECIQRLAALNLSIDFDLYAEGNFFKEDTDWE